MVKIMTLSHYTKGEKLKKRRIFSLTTWHRHSENGKHSKSKTRTSNQ